MATTIKEELSHIALERERKGRKKPHLAAVLVGHDGGSETYVSMKMKACQEVGFSSSLIRFEADVTEERLLEEVDRLNLDSEIDAFLVQLPLPEHIDSQKVLEAIDPEKDADGFHPINVGRMVVGLPSIVPATPRGILELLRRYNIETRGKRIAILGRSNIVGKPLAQMLMQKGLEGDATVTVCHTATPDIPSITREADIVIAAVGQPGFVTKDMIREGSVVVDVGTTRVPDASRKSGFRLMGDVDFPNVAPLTSYITPVPGGVGPMTIASLLLNTLELVERRERDQ